MLIVYKLWKVCEGLLLVIVGVCGVVYCRCCDKWSEWSGNMGCLVFIMKEMGKYGGVIVFL